jgi:hypothetical protein
MPPRTLCAANGRSPTIQQPRVFAAIPHHFRIRRHSFRRSVKDMALLGGVSPGREGGSRLFNQLAGGMIKEQAQTLGRLFNRGEWAGVMRHGRLLPAFAGATMDRLAGLVETFNKWTRRSVDSNSMRRAS